MVFLAPSAVSSAQVRFLMGFGTWLYTPAILTALIASLADGEVLLAVFFVVLTGLDVLLIRTWWRLRPPGIDSRRAYAVSAGTMAASWLLGLALLLAGGSDWSVGPDILAVAVLAGFAALLAWRVRVGEQLKALEKKHGVHDRYRTSSARRHAKAKSTKARRRPASRR